MRRSLAIFLTMVLAVFLSGCGDGGGNTLAVELDEWTVLPEQQQVAAGEITFEAENVGEEVHELVIIRGSVTELPTAEDGSVPEAEIPEEDFIGEIEEFPAGEARTGTFTLEPGTYALICNIVETENGETESHFQMGMGTNLTVTE